MNPFCLFYSSDIVSFSLKQHGDMLQLLMNDQIYIILVTKLHKQNI